MKICKDDGSFYAKMWDCGVCDEYYNADRSVTGDDVSCAMYKGEKKNGNSMEIYFYENMEDTAVLFLDGKSEGKKFRDYIYSLDSGEVKSLAKNALALYEKEGGGYNSVDDMYSFFEKERERYRLAEKAKCESEGKEYRFLNKGEDYVEFEKRLEENPLGRLYFELKGEHSDYDGDRTKVVIKSVYGVTCFVREEFEINKDRAGVERDINDVIGVLKKEKGKVYSDAAVSALCKKWEGSIEMNPLSCYKMMDDSEKIVKFKRNAKDARFLSYMLPLEEELVKACKWQYVLENGDILYSLEKGDWKKDGRAQEAYIFKRNFTSMDAVSFLKEYREYGKKREEENTEKKARSR